MKGNLVEDFSLKDQNGEEFRLYDNLDKKVLLVFYPKDSSFVCSMQLNNYWSNLELFEKNDIKVVPINPEGALSHSGFCAHLGADFRILIDSGKEVSRRFRALNFLGLNKRKVVLIGTDRRILFEKAVFSAFYQKAQYLIEKFRKLKII